MCSGSETGSYFRLIDFVYHSTLGLRVIKKKDYREKVEGDGSLDRDTAVERIWHIQDSHGLGFRVQALQPFYVVPSSLGRVPGRSQFENNYFTEMCSGSETGSYFRLIDFVYHSTLGLRVLKKKECRDKVEGDGSLDRDTAVERIRHT